MLFQDAQLPKISNESQRIWNYDEPDVNLSLNSSLNRNLHISTIPGSAEVSHFFVNPKAGKHPLDKYSSPPEYVHGYYDPSFESVETDRCEFRGNLPRAIRSGERDKFNVLIHCEHGVPDEFARHDDELWHYHRYELNDSVDNVYDTAYDRTNESNRYSLNNVSQNKAYAHRVFDPNTNNMTANSMTANSIAANSMTANSIAANSMTANSMTANNDAAFPYTNDDIHRPTKSEQRYIPTLDDIPLYRTPTKSRLPAGMVFSNVSPKQEQEMFDIRFGKTDENANLVLTMSNAEMNALGIEAFNSKGTKTNITETFESEIMDDADYMYLEALKTRANAICSYLQNNKSYKTWSHNWKLLERNLRSGMLFQRLDDSDADIAYVVNKGEEVKFRIRDKKRYIPINVYQYVLYHEMAHMSTEEKQHTLFFCKLLNIISLAGFECGFIDIQKLTYDYFKTNGAPILCKASMKEEIMEGAEWLKEVNPQSQKYYDGIIDAVKSA